MILRLPLVILGCLISIANAGPVSWDDTKCSQHCSGGTKFQYAEEQTYVYSYESSNGLIAEKTSDLSMKLAATVSLTVVSKCEMYLKLSDVTIHHGPEKLDSSTRLITELQRRVLPFSWNDGKIDHVCPDPEDSDEVNNIKKAILSVFQNSMRSFEYDAFSMDTDILGTCDTEYKSVEKGVEKFEIIRIKNIPTCSNHIKGKTLLLASFYPSSSHRQHLPFLTDEKSTCKEIVDNGILTEAICQETAYFKPLSDYGYVVQAIGSSKIKLMTHNDASKVTYNAPKKECLVYKYQAHSNKKENAESEARAILEHICENSKDLITKNTASYIHKLVYTIRQMDDKAVENVYTALKSREICDSSKKAESMYLDALKMASSGGAITLLTKLSQNGEMSLIDSMLWTTVMPFTSYVEEESIAAAIPLLKKGAVNRQSLLGATALAYKYCSSNPDCGETKAVKDMSSNLKLLLGDKCHAENIEDETEILTVLKSFGNLGYFAESSKSVFECALNPANRIEVRVGAIEAFRRAPCTEDLVSHLLDLYANKAEVDELRIAALISLSRCANREVIEVVVRSYTAETSRQVQVFTWSYLNNLRSSSDPTKAKIRLYMTALSLKEPDSTDITKFSRNFESSFFSEIFNLGHSLSGNIIHSSESFLPRSGNLGLKLDVLSNQLEAFEVGGHVEGLEHILEKVFGPMGIFSNIQLNDVVHLLQHYLKRSKRAADSYQTKIDSLTERIGYNRTKVPRGTAFIRILGHELGLLHLNEASIKRVAGIKVNDLLKNLASLGDIDISKNILFADVAAVFPSITGRAYKLAANGSLTVGLKAEGKVDLKSGFPFPEADIDGTFKPSSLDEVTAAFTIYSEDFEPGVKVETIISGGLDYKAKVELKDGRIAHVKLSRGKNKEEIMNFKRTMYFINHAGQTEMPKPDSYNLNYCTKYIQNILGAKYCASMSIPHFYEKGKFKIPFVRAMEAAFTVEQTDPSMEGYELYLELPDLKNKEEKKFKFLVDTPKSTQDRKFSVEVDFKHPDESSCSLVANVHSRFYSMDLNANMLNQENLFRLTADATGDNRRKYSININAPKVVKGARLVEYQPKIKLSAPSIRPVELTGTFVFSKGRKEQLTINLESRSFGSPFTVKGTLSKEGEQIDLSTNWKLNYEMNANAFSQIHRLNGAIGYVVDKGLLIDLGHHYEPDGRSYESITVNAKVENIKIFDRLGFSIDSKVLFAEHQDLNTMLKWDFSFEPLNHLRSDLIFRYGENFEDDTHLVRSTIVSELHGDFDNFRKMSISNKLGLTISCLDFDKSASLVAEWDFIDQPKLVLEAGVKTDKDKECKFEFSYAHLQAKPLKLATAMTITFNRYKFKYTDEGNEIAPGEYEWKSVIEPMKGKEISTDFVYRIKNKDPSKYGHEIDGTIKFPGFSIKQKGSLEFHRGDFNFHSLTDFGRGSSYDLELHFKNGGKSELKLATPFIEGNMAIDSSGDVRTIAANFKSKGIYDRRIVVIGKVTPGDTTVADVEVQLDADSDSEKKVHIEITLKKGTEDGSEKHMISGFVKYAGSINVDVTGKISTDLLRGPHSFRAALLGKDAIEPMAIEIEHEIKDGQLTTVTRYSRNNAEKIRLDFKGKYIRVGFNHLDVELGLYLSSPYKTFDGKLAFFRLFADSNKDTRSFLSEYRVKFSPGIGYEGKIDYLRNRGWTGSIKSNLLITVHNRPLYESSTHVEYRYGKYSFKTSFTPISKKKTHLLASFEHDARFVALHHSFATNLHYLQTLDLNAVADLRNMEDAKIESNLDVNVHKIYDVNSTLKMRTIVDFDVETKLFSRYTPSVRIYSRSQASGQVIKVDFSLDVDSKSVVTGHGELKKRKRGFNGDINFNYEEKEIFVLTVHQDGKGKHERNYLVKLKFPSRLYTANVKTNKDKKDDVSLNVYETKFCRNEVLCIEINTAHKSYPIGNEYVITYKRDDVQFSIERIRESSNGIERFHTVIYNGDHRYGYDALFGQEGAATILGLGIILPLREIVTKAAVEFSLSKPRVKLELNLDGRNHPERRLVTDIRFENHLTDSSPSKLQVTIAHEIFEKPIEIEVSGDYEPTSAKFFTAEASIDYSNNPDDKLLGKLDVERPPGGKGEILLKMYHKDDSNLDFVIKISGTSNADEESFGIKYTWQEADGEKEAHMIGSYPKKEKRFFFDYKRPKISYRLDGTIIPPRSLLNDTCEIHLESTYNGQKTKANLVSDYGTGCHKLNVLDDEGQVSRVIDLCINFSSRRMVSLVTDSFDDEGLWTFDFLSEIIQRNWNTIGVRIQANPEFLGKYLFLLTSLGDELDNSGVGTLPFYDSPRFKIIRRSFNSKVFQPATEFLLAEAQKFFKDMFTDISYLRNAIFNYYKKLPSFDVLKEKALVVVAYSRLAVMKVYSYYEDKFNVVFNYVDDVKESVHKQCNDIDECRKLVRSYEREGFTGILKEIKELLLSLPARIEHFLEHAEVGNFMDGAVAQIKAALKPLTNYRCGQLLYRAVELSYEALEPKVKALMSRMPNIYRRMKHTILSNEYVIEAREILQKGIARLRDAVKNNYKKVFVLARKHLEDFLADLSPPSVNRYYTINALEKGVFDIDIYSNVVDKISKRFRAILGNLVRNSIRIGSDYSWNTVVIVVKKGLDLNFIPPYDAQAMIIDHQHFITFDKTFYAFSGECAYLLARDFEDGNFSIILKPNKDSVPSVVIVKAETTVEVNSGLSSVKVGDQGVELPYLSKDLFVTREGSTIHVDTKNGLHVKCNLVREICTFSMSGWYFGKTAGLFGTYNYEDSDDMKRPKGQIANSVNVFAKSWELKKGCKPDNLYQEGRINKNSDYYKQCKLLFESESSPLAACFSEVRPDKYFDLCLRLLGKETYSKKAYCNAATAYVKECEKNYVETNLPSKCLTCVGPNDSKLEHGDRKKFEKLNTKSADIVFLVEDHDCNKVLLSDLGAIAKSMEKELQNEGFRDILFGLVGFAGGIGEPKIFTGRDEVLFNSRDINNIVGRFKLENKKFDTKAFEAMNLAVTHLFRSDTVKSLVLLSCSPCKYDYSSLQYPVIQQILLERGISLHIIRDTAILTRKGATKVENIGVDPDTVFHTKDVTQPDLIGEPSLRSQVILPKDLCVALSQDVNGSFFSSHSLSKSSASEVKNWRNVFSRKILKSNLGQLSPCQLCDCTTRDNIPITICQPCETKRPRLPFSVGSTSAHSRTLESFLSYILHVIRE